MKIKAIIKKHKATCLAALALLAAVGVAFAVLGGAKAMQELPVANITQPQTQVLVSSATRPVLPDILPEQMPKTGGNTMAATSNSPPPQVSVQNSAPAVSAQPEPDWDKIISAFEVKAQKYYNNTHYSSNHYDYTQKELRMLAVVIYLEARNQPYACQAAVGNVVMNRVLSKGYPGSTIASVVTRRNQFCYSPSVKPNAECLNVARDVLDYEVWTVPQSTYFFRATRKKGNWGSHSFVAKLGNTSFYGGKYAGRSRVASVPPRLFQRVFKWPQYGCKPAARVRKLQIMLKSLGYQTDTDGYFGMDTKKAVQKFQKASRMQADGVAGPGTIKALIKKYGVEKYGRL